MECNCELEQEAVDQEHLLCDQSQPNETVFRAEITTYQLTRDDLLIILQNMITGGKLMINESSFFRLDDSCPVEIASFNDPLCVTPTTKTVKSQETVSNKGGIPTGAIVGSIIAILIIIILMILGILFILYWRNKHRYSNISSYLSAVNIYSYSCCIRMYMQLLLFNCKRPVAI